LTIFCEVIKDESFHPENALDGNGATIFTDGQTATPFTMIHILTWFRPFQWCDRLRTCSYEKQWRYDRYDEPNS